MTAMKKLSLILFLMFIVVEFSQGFWFVKPKKKEEGFWNELSIKLPGIFGGNEKLPMTEKQAIQKGWKKTDTKKCNGHSIFRGNRYRYKENYGNMLLFDSNGHIAGMQTAVPTSVNMVEQRKDMLPVENNRYHLTVYFMEPENICNAPKRGDKDIGDKFLIQTGRTWKSKMNVPIKEKDLSSTGWVKGKCIPGFGTYYWYEISKGMDCEKTFPIMLLYSNGKLNAFGYSFKGYFNDKKFDHPNSGLAFMAFNKKTFPDCIANSKSKEKGSTQHVYLQSGFTNYMCPIFG